MLNRCFCQNIDIPPSPVLLRVVKQSVGSAKGWRPCRVLSRCKLLPWTRLYCAPPSPSQQECFYLRLLLHEIAGPTSFTDTKGIECQSYREACFRLVLLEDDSQWDTAMAEGELLRTPSRLRTLFAILLLRCELSDLLSLWLKYRESMSEDVLFSVQRNSPGVECVFTDFIVNRALVAHLN